jgi:hypothetical protein
VRTIAIAFAAGLAVSAVPVQAQGILDTFRELKGTVETLAGKSTQAASGSLERRYDVSEFTVAGIKLGMTPDEVETVMREARFRIDKIGEIISFSELVQREADRLRQPNPVTKAGRSVSSIFGKDEQGNFLSVDFISLREGARVKEVSLTFNGNTIDVATLRSDVIARYDQPTIDDRYQVTLHWCSHEETQCRIVGSTASQLWFTQYVGSHSLKLSNANAMQAQQNKQIASYFSAPTADRQRSLLGGS